MLRVLKIVSSFSKNSRSFSVMASKLQSSEIGKAKPVSEMVNVGHVPVTVSEDQTEGTAVLPGFSYGDLDRTGDVEPWRVMMLHQSGEDNVAYRGRHQSGRDAFDMDEVLKSGSLIFTISAKVDIMAEMYTRKNDFMYKPVNFREYLNKVGKTSMEFVREIHSQKGFPLSRVVQNVVFVDKETHVPVLHPEYVTKKFGKTKPKIIFERFIPDEKPEDAFHTTYRVMWSDIDYYYHSNQTSYPRYALNAITEASFAGHLKNFPTGDLAHHKVHCMTMIYMAQSRPGDTLDIYVWEDRLIHRRVHCQLHKQQQVVYNTAIDFFDPEVLQAGDEHSAKGKL